MNRFKNILFVADALETSQRALERAVALAKTNQAKLTVVTVIGEVEEDEALTHSLGTTLSHILHDYQQQSLSEWLKPFDSNETSIATHILHGSAFAEIIRTVIENDHDLVIKASSPPAKLSEKLLGSTDMHLFRKCPCPVWIDKPDKNLPYRRILAAVDPLADKSTAIKIMELSTSLAQRENAQLEVVHAWCLEGEPILRSGRVNLSDAEIDYVIQKEQRNHIHHLDELLNPFAMKTADANVHLRKGDAVTQILEAGQQADLIVMGTIGRVGISGFLIGNTAEEVMQLTQASILAVKPDGYVSPLA